MPHSKFTIISTFGMTSILKTDKFSFVQQHSVRKALDEPFDLTTGEVPVTEGITLESYFPISHTGGCDS